MNDKENDSFLEELNQRARGISGAYYILNTLVSRFDGSRIIGPLTIKELETKAGAYLGVMRRVSYEEAEQFPLLIYRFINDAFERTNEIKFFSSLTS